MKLDINAEVWTRRGAYGITCRHERCDFAGWGWTRDQVMERLAEHAETECPWVSPMKGPEPNPASGPGGAVTPPGLTRAPRRP